VRRIFKGFGILVLLVFIAVAFKLVPPHLQIRSVSPDLPTTAQLQGLRTVDNGPVKISYINTASQSLGDVVFGYSTFVVEWEDGKILLIDLGMDEAEAVEFGKLIEKIMSADPTIPHGPTAKFLGGDIARVQGVAFTHLHSDHVQGVEALCKAGARAVTALHAPYQMTKHNLHTKAPFEMLQNSVCLKQMTLAHGAYTSEQFPGVGIFPMGGHTPGSTLFAVPVAGKLWLLSGDITNTKNDLINNTGKGALYSYIFVPEHEARLKTLRQWLRELETAPDTTVVVAHDIRVLEKSGIPEWQAAE